MKFSLKLLCLTVALFFIKPAVAQDKSHVRWSYSIQKPDSESDPYKVRIIGSIDTGCFIYSKFIPSSYVGLATDVSVNMNGDAKVIGIMKEEGTKIPKEDIHIYKDSYILTFNIILESESVNMKCIISWTECDSDGKCKRMTKKFSTNLVRDDVAKQN